ncbi:MAG: amidase family protein [Pseudomonadota bacterium]
MTLTSLTAADLGRAIAAGTTTPMEATEAYLDAAGALPEAHDIFTVMTPERALAEAEAATQRARDGVRRGPLDGVPISWKDLFDSAGTATEAGSQLLKGRVPDADARVLAQATQEGLICLGKTHMSELAFSGLGINPKTATSPNALMPGHAPGGSSSGAAASVAFGLAAAGIGSDTGGSVRIPAAWNDLVGLKTTSGLLSLGGVVQLCPRFDTVGPLCRSVEDAALLLEAMGGPKAPDLTQTSASQLHLAVLDTTAFDDIRPEPAAAFEASVGRLTTAGVTVSHIKIPQVAEAMALSGPLFTAEAYATCGALIETAPELVFDRVLGRFRAGRDVDAVSYIRAWQALEGHRAAYAAATARFDGVILPASPNLPPDVARALADEDYFVTENLLALRNTRIGNLMGLAAITLPTDAPACGLQVLGRPMGEAHLLRVAAALEPLLQG